MPQRKLYPNPLQVVFSDEQMAFISKEADERHYGIKADVVRKAIDQLIGSRKPIKIDLDDFDEGETDEMVISK